MTGREVLSADRIPVTREPRDEVPLSQAELIPPMKCDAGTGPCLTQCIQTEHVQGHGQVDQAVHGYGVSDSNVTPVTIEQLDMLMIPSLTSEAGTELCPAKGTVDHGEHEDVNPDGTRGVCDRVPRPQTMIPPTTT